MNEGHTSDAPKCQFVTKAEGRIIITYLSKGSIVENIQ